MGQQNPFNIFFSSSYKIQRPVSRQYATTGLQHAGLLASAEMRSIGFQTTGHEIRSTKPVEQFEDYLKPLVSYDLAVFPKTNEVVVNEHGVFVPRSLFGANAKISYQVTTRSE